MDGFAGPDAVRALESQLKSLGKDATLHVHAGADHGFFNDTRPDVYDAAASKTAFSRTLDLFASTLT
jgi:carboxymethylenebutenolidase